MTDNLHKKTLLHLLKDRAYKHGQFTLSSGKETEHYINCKPVTLSCEGNALLSHLMIKEVENDAIAVGGLTLGAESSSLRCCTKSILFRPSTS